MGWTFDQAPNVACITTQAVLDGHPVLAVTHYDDDHSWAFMDGSNTNNADTRVVAMRTVLERHPELEATAHLLPGQTATRASAGDAWVTEPHG